MIHLPKQISNTVRVRRFILALMTLAAAAQSQVTDSIAAADTIATADTTNNIPNAVPSYKAPRSARIIAAIGTTAAIGGIITFIFVRKSKESTDDGSEIPDPPAPPEL